jgi:putative ABC transport system permease protein
MKFTKKFELAWNMLVHSKIRSWLTIIGIIIGIGSVVAIMAISEGAQQQMEDNLASMDTDQITISAGASRAMGFGGGPGRDFGGATSSTSTDDEDDPELTTRDLLVIRAVDNVRIASASVSSNEELVYASKKADVSVVAIDPKYWDDVVGDDGVAEGRGLTSSDSYSIVIGGDVADGTFDGMQLNRQLTLAGRTFKVVGILGEGRTSYISLSAVEVLEDKESGVYDSIVAFADDATLVENTTSDIEEALMLSRGILFNKDKDFSVSNMLSMQETISDTLTTISLFLSAIAAISLLVGGIGIANTMFTSVLEKTREIGIMKAIGAKNGDVLHIFLINSGLIGFVGGVGGVVLGVLSSFFVSTLIGGGSSGGGGMGRMISLGGASYVSVWLIVFALVFSIVIGMIAGVIPAYNASKLKPVDALRYE